jgi:hypothetical protein
MSCGTTMSFTITQSLTWTCNYNYSKRTIVVLFTGCKTQDMLLWALPFILKNILRKKNNYGNSNISRCQNQGCQNQRDATILHPTSPQHPSWRVCHVYQNEHRKLFIDIWATPIINGNQNRFWSPILWLFFITNLVAIKKNLIALFCCNQNFSVTMEGGHVICFWKAFVRHVKCFLKVLDKDFPKTYDTPPFCGDWKVSVTIKKGLPING